MSADIVEILNRCGSDKARVHSYGEVYAELFADRQLSKSVLEIGVYRGASLRAWHEFFTCATIVGIDTSPKPDCRLPADRAVCIKINATNAKAVAEVALRYGPFDIVIDDGSHDPKEQRTACDLFMKHVKSGGLYVIEDVRTIEVARSLASVYGGSVFDLRAVKKKWNDILVVFKKGHR